MIQYNNDYADLLAEAQMKGGSHHCQSAAAAAAAAIPTRRFSASAATAGTYK